MATIADRVSRRTIMAYLGSRRGRSAGPLDVISRIREGIPADSVRRFMSRFGFTLDDLDRFLRLPKSTTARALRKRRRFSAVQSEKIKRLMEVLALAVEVLEDEDRALRWLREPNRALGGGPPAALLDTDSGTHLVENTLHRIEHGVYS